MLSTFGRLVFGTPAMRLRKSLRPLVARIGELEWPLQQRDDGELRIESNGFRTRLERGATLEDLLPEALALYREASRRVLKVRPVDVQLMGALVLHRGAVAEIQEGEQKPLTAAMAAYINALTGKGVHVAVKQGLLDPHAEGLRRIGQFLGFSVGTVAPWMSDEDLRDAYRCDVTYGEHGVFAFHYLRDNMKPLEERPVQRGHHFAIVDEADAVLIDDAQLRMIIPQEIDRPTEEYRLANQIAISLRPGLDYVADPLAGRAMLTDAGQETVMRRLGVKNPQTAEGLELLYQVSQAVTANALYVRDTHYVVEGGAAVQVNPHTRQAGYGRRLMLGGLQQAIEAKEGLAISRDSRPLALITHGSYFRLYEKLAGMSATALGAEDQFKQNYRLNVVPVPRNMPRIRWDRGDLVFATEAAKLRAALAEAADCHERSQPILFAARDYEQADALCELLKAKGLSYDLLDPSDDEEDETDVLAGAGRPGVITVCVSHPRRGAAIVLGGNPGPLARLELDDEDEAPEGSAAFDAAVKRHEVQCKIDEQRVKEAGGLCVIGLYRHMIRRFDDQLRALAGWKDEPGRTQFFLSMEDELLSAQKIEILEQAFQIHDWPPDMPVDNPAVVQVIDEIQRRTEEVQVSVLRNLAHHDDVIERQRKVVYDLRRQIVEGRYIRSKADGPEGVASTAGILSSGPHTADSLFYALRPMLSRTVNATGPFANVFSQAVHEEFGVWPEELGDLAVDLSEKLERVARQVAGSLCQQRERLVDLCEQTLVGLMDQHFSPGIDSDGSDLGALTAAVSETFAVMPDLGDADLTADREILERTLWERVEAILGSQERRVTLPMFLYFFRRFLIEDLDSSWVEHLQEMELRHAAAFGQSLRNPEARRLYEEESFGLFTEMMDGVRRSVCEMLFHIQIQEPSRVAANASPIQTTATSRTARTRSIEARATSGSRPKIGRNDACPCGSGKKFKRCHGAFLDEGEL